MRLDVVEGHILSFKKSFQGADLVDEAVRELLAPDLHLAAPEALSVRKRRVRADLDAVSLSQLHRGAHVIEIGSVEPTGDVGDMDGRHNAAVVAQAPDALTLAHVAVQERHPASAGNAAQSRLQTRGTL